MLSVKLDTKDLAGEAWPAMVEDDDGFVVAYIGGKLARQYAGLFAAAPELLAAMRAMLPRNGCFCGSGDNPMLAGKCSQSCRTACEAIKKAEAYSAIN